MIRLDALISNSGAYSRSEIKVLVKKGRVTVNGQTVKDYSLKVSESDVISVDGKPLDTEKFVYIMLNKPAGYISATEGEKNVIELVPPEMFRKGLFPVGNSPFFISPAARAMFRGRRCRRLSGRGRSAGGGRRPPSPDRRSCRR